MIFKKLNNSINCVTFADRTKIDFDTGIGGANRLLFIIKNQTLHASSAHCVSKFFVCRYSFWSFYKSPGPAERTCSDVVCTVSRIVDCFCQLDEVVKLRFKCNRAIIIRHVEASDAGIIAIDGHLHFQLIDQVETSLSECQSPQSVGRHAEFEVSPHCLTSCDQKS